MCKEPAQARNIGWNTDHSYDLDPRPGSVLCARKVPQTGGDMRFAGMHAA